MEYLHYQKRINDVIIKCPIEAGIEILVYSIFDEILSTAEDKYALVDINRIWKNQDSRLSTETGISDIAIMSPDFVFKNEDVGTVYGFIEVKAAGVSLRDTEQISGQMKNISHFIYTNGIVWKYYFNQVQEWEINLCTQKLQYSTIEIEVNESDFLELKERIRLIVWEQR